MKELTTELNTKNQYEFQSMNAEPEIPTTKKLRTEQLVYYKGDQERGDEIIKALENLGGADNNYSDISGAAPSYIYFINPNGKIDFEHGDSSFGLFIKEFYTEAHLPEPKLEFKPFDKVLVQCPFDCKVRRWIPSHFKDLCDNDGSLRYEQYVIIPYESNEDKAYQKVEE